MANTTSWAFPNIFDVSQNKVAMLADRLSIVNRTRLLILTDPTALYNEPNQGVGLRRFIGQYNTKNKRAEIRDLTVEQLRLHEPCVIPDETQWADGLVFTNAGKATPNSANKLEMTMSLHTVYDNTVNVDLNSDVNVDA
jgi:phage baseplate assembly protein W